MIIEISMAVFFQSLVLILLCQFLAYVKFKQRYQKQQKKMKSLENDLQALLICARGVGEKLHNQEDEFRYIQERQEKIELNKDNHTTPPYKQMMALINHGASKHDMLDDCDLTKGEVELMLSLKQKANQLQHSYQI